MRGIKVEWRRLTERKGKGGGVKERLKVGFPFPQAGSDLPDPFCEFLHSVPTNWQTTTFDP